VAVMAKLLYSAIVSLDGYVADEDGNFDWAAPDEQVHTFVNDLERPIGTYLYGRRMYEVMSYWEDPDDLADQPPYVRDYAEIWQAADKVVYSSTLGAVSTARTRLEHRFHPDAVLAIKAVLAGLSADLMTRTAEMRRINDEQRVRENMKALKGSSEEQQLVRRYATQLSQQEDRVEALRKESEDLERKRRDAQAELARRIDALSADISVRSQ
jgi:hypothetical protein